MPDPPRHLRRLTHNMRRNLEQLRLEEDPVTDPGELFERLQACRRMHFAARVRGRNLAHAGDRPPRSMINAFFEDMTDGIKRAGPVHCMSVWLAMGEFMSSRWDERYLQRLINVAADAEAAAERELRAATSER